MENSRTYLKELLEKYKNHEVSVFVGAGFSRNAYSKFPLWGGLLKELVLDIYGEKIMVEIADFVRRQEKFDDIETLKQNIAADKDKSLKILKSLDWKK